MRLIKMNYIITGGTGFIGTHLANLIKELYSNAKYISPVVDGYGQGGDWCGLADWRFVLSAGFVFVLMTTEGDL